MIGPTDGHDTHDGGDPLHELLIDWGQRERAAAGRAPVEALKGGRSARPGWPRIAAAAAATVAVAFSATLVASHGRDIGPADSTPPTANATPPGGPPQDLKPIDGPLTVTPTGAAQPPLSRQQAEAIMMNSWPPPPLAADPESQIVQGSLRFGLAAVVLASDVRRANGDVPGRLPLAWVVTWEAPDGSRTCPTPGVPAPFDSTTRQEAYVLAADGSSAYSFSDASGSCQTREQAPELAPARVQRAVNRVSVAWTGNTRDANGDVLMTFDRPVCATAGGLGTPQGQMIFVEIPVGTSCTATVPDSIRTGPKEPQHHPLLGPIRMSNGQALPARAPG